MECVIVALLCYYADKCWSTVLGAARTVGSQLSARTAKCTLVPPYMHIGVYLVPLLTPPCYFTSFPNNHAGKSEEASANTTSPHCPPVITWALGTFLTLVAHSLIYLSSLYLHVDAKLFTRTRLLQKFIATDKAEQTEWHQLHPARPRSSERTQR